MVSNYNIKTGVRTVNFSVGVFFLRGNAKKGKKLRLTWKGPYRVTECRFEYLFQIEDLVAKERSVSHGRRLKHLRNTDFEFTGEVLNYLPYQQGELLVVEGFEDIREKMANWNVT